MIKSRLSTILYKLTLGFFGWSFWSVIVVDAAWASDVKRDLKAVKSTEILDRLSRQEDVQQLNYSKSSGLGVLKDLLFDEMFLFTAVSAGVLLIALIGAAIMISKRKSNY